MQIARRTFVHPRGTNLTNPLRSLWGQRRGRRVGVAQRSQLNRHPGSWILDSWIIGKDGIRTNGGGWRGERIERDGEGGGGRGNRRCMCGPGPNTPPSRLEWLANLPVVESIEEDSVVHVVQQQVETLTQPGRGSGGAHKAALVHRRQCRWGTTGSQAYPICATTARHERRNQPFDAPVSLVRLIPMSCQDRGRKRYLYPSIGPFSIVGHCFT